MYTYRAKVNRIIDGDSIVLDLDLGFDTWINNQSVRLVGVDAPESRTRDLVEKQFGNLAKERVKELLEIGSYVIVKTYKDKEGKFGRILGEILTNEEININDLLIEERLAVFYEGQSKEEVVQEHLANRKYLIKEGKISLDENK
jgi:micrococcal nuclease|tara:strand:+ start:6793 stop:7224 length:432 start_codon:yes stop_codon:yes gene_type:complete